MLSREAEDRFRDGMQLLARGHAREALPFFHTAIQFQKEYDDGPGTARYLSYYGLCVSLTRGCGHEALRCCRLATKREDFNAELWWNLGRAALALGRRSEAYRALTRGLALEPKHKGIRQDLGRMGERRPQILSFLSRNHPVNVVLGRLR